MERLGQPLQSCLPLKPMADRVPEKPTPKDPAKDLFGEDLGASDKSVDVLCRGDAQPELRLPRQRQPPAIWKAFPHPTNGAGAPSR